MGAAKLLLSSCASMCIKMPTWILRTWQQNWPKCNMSEELGKTQRQTDSVERADGRYNPLTTGRRVEQKFWLTEPDWNRRCDIRIMNRAARGLIYDMIYAGHGHYYFEIRRNCSLIFRL